MTKRRKTFDKLTRESNRGSLRGKWVSEPLRQGLLGLAVGSNLQVDTQPRKKVLLPNTYWNLASNQDTTLPKVYTAFEISSN